MSKAVKSMIARDYTARMEKFSDAMVISIRGMKGIATTKLRGRLAKDHVKVTVVRNSLVRRNLKGGSLDGLADILSGPSAMVYGGGSVVEAARAIVALLPEFPGLELKGAILDGNLFKGDAGVKELSKYPTKKEAISQAVTLIVSPGKKLVAQIKGPGAGIAGIISAIESKLEKGEAISKVA